MTPDTSEVLIDIDALRVGMFVHLEGGWMSHPFALSNFRINSGAQLETIRSLGAQRIRWCPQRSDLAPSLNPSGGDGGPGQEEALDLPVIPAAICRSLNPPPEKVPGTALPTPMTRTDSVHDPRVHLQSAALDVCERQFAEAAHDCRKIFSLTLTRPQEAHLQAAGLTQALIAKMVDKQELSIRFLSHPVGDTASMHALNVTVISMLMGRTFGLPASDMLDLGMGALLHDIGELDLPDRLRHRNEHFSGADARIYEEHVARGVAVARKMKLTVGATQVIAQHHEHADGTGFPARLNTDRMTAAARIVSLVDSYDNLCNPYLPSQALTPHESLSLLFAHGKTKFDTAILGAFIRMMGVYPAGSTVQLTDDRYALVVGVNASRPLKPRVFVHDAGVAREEALILDLESTQGLGIRRCIKPQQLPDAALDYLAPCERVAYFFEPFHKPVSVP